MKRRLVVAALAVLALAGCGGSDDALDELRTAPHPFFYLGESYRGLSLTDVRTSGTRPPAGSPLSASFTYSECRRGSFWPRPSCTPRLRLVNTACFEGVAVTVTSWSGPWRNVDRVHDSLRPLNAAARGYRPGTVSLGQPPIC